MMEGVETVCRLLWLGFAALGALVIDHSPTRFGKQHDGLYALGVGTIVVLGWNLLAQPHAVVSLLLVCFEGCIYILNILVGGFERQRIGVVVVFALPGIRE